MNKITVLKPGISLEQEHISSWGNAHTPIEARERVSGAIDQMEYIKKGSVEITDEEIEDEANKVHKSNGLHGYYIDGYHDGFMAAYEFIKQRINQ